MKVLEKKILVSKNDLDDLNHVNNVVYIQWIQKIAKEHWEKLASNEILDNYYWVLLEHQIKYLYPALLDDKIRIKTYIDSTEEIKSSRIVEIYNNDTNRLLVNSRTIWCLINSKTNKPVRIPDEIRQVFNK
ncbi:MAG: thioesterase family protein [Bacteroidota bacterium]|nr:thioesterase family protein [Bacteroidota bacterium]|tara:strand:- start:5073 stop:5465 length:393 start_codon:yes stop_codon:yes gene_type:complete